MWRQRRRTRRRSSRVRAREDWASDLWHGFGAAENGAKAAKAAKVSASASTSSTPSLQLLFEAAISQLKTSRRVQTIVTLAVGLLVIRAATRNRDAAYLTDLGVSHGVLTPRFSPRRQEYVLEIPEDLMQLTLRPVPKYESAVVSVGSVQDDPSADSNVTIMMSRPSSVTSTRTEKLLRIVVRSQKQQQQHERTYTVRVKRALPLPVGSMDVGVFGRPKQGSGVEGGRYYLGEDAFFAGSRRSREMRSSKSIAAEGQVDEKGLFFYSFLPQASSIGVADGVGGWKEMGVDPGEYSKSLMEVAANEMIGAQQPVRPEEALKQAQTAEETQVPGTCTATVLDIDQKRMLLRAANLGDSGYIVFRNGKEVCRSQAQLHQFNMPYQLGSLEIEPDSNTAEDADLYTTPVREGDVVVLATDGLFDNVSNMRIGKLVQSGIERNFDPVQIAELLVDEAYRNSFASTANTPWALAMTKEVVPRWKRVLGTGIRGGKRDDITVMVGIVRSDFL
eukprot:CAMPEP_0114498706 /NCGR_PEP_ID=MMETSP0109-20121206/7016_1 /TAXON_ID=29199 /ORGANISM="Chlorarachnion reptans, Strain CCCM449" /LENGTH=504 /DNA_ID=CAMNT_0001676203 /DNA_START=255 /DNA_END=1769 /DNA_ORIENTATION=-